AWTSGRSSRPRRSIVTRLRSANGTAPETISSIRRPRRSGRRERTSDAEVPPARLSIANDHGAEKPADAGGRNQRGFTSGKTEQDAHGAQKENQTCVLPVERVRLARIALIAPVPHQRDGSESKRIGGRSMGL